jgi:hypothetical protein
VGTTIVPIRMRILIGNFPLQQSHIRVTLGFNQGRVGKGKKTRSTSEVGCNLLMGSHLSVQFSGQRKGEKQQIERIDNSFER